MVGHSRRKTADNEVETWVDWVKRTTKLAERQMAKIGIDSWVLQYRRRKWQWAGQLIRDNHDKCSHKLLCWEPKLEAQARGGRGIPRIRWDDELTATAGDWKTKAKDAAVWHELF